MTGDETTTTKNTTTTKPKRDERDRDKYETRELFCQLTDDELLEFGKKMAERDREIAVLDSKIDALKLNQKALRGEADRLGLDRSRLAIAIDTGQEPRDVECTWREAADGFVMELVRDDTSEIVATRPMKENEKQRALDFENTDDEPTAPGVPPGVASTAATGVVAAVDDDDELLPLETKPDASTTTTSKRASTRRTFDGNN
jgi:hypothetical protein